MPTVPPRPPTPCFAPRSLGAGFDLLEFASSMIEPTEPSTLALTFDDWGAPRHAVVVTGTPTPDAVHDVADLLERSLADRPELGALVIVSVRPGHPCESLDVDRLLDLTSRFDERGVELLEWWIWSGATRTPMRQACGLPSRW